MYPIRGIAFLVANPSLWTAVFVPIVLSLALALVIFLVLLAGAFYPQALLFLHHTALPHWASWLLALGLVFVETVLVVLLAVQLLLDHVRVRIYARVFELQGVPFDKLQRVAYGEGRPCFQWVSQRIIFLFLVAQALATMPINLLPVVGTACYAVINGVAFGWALHGIYFEQKGLSFLQQWAFVKARLRDYVAFGAVAVLLESIPVLNIAIFYTNIIGSALWAVELERARELEHDAPSLLDDDDDDAIHIDVRDRL